MTSLPELKSCFYCTGTAERYGAKLHHGVQCINCGLQLSMTSHCARDEIVHVWNNITRTPSPHNKEITGDAVTREDTGCAGTTDATFSASAVTTSPTTIEDAELREAVEHAQKSLEDLRPNNCPPRLQAWAINALINHAMKGQRG